MERTLVQPCITFYLQDILYGFSADKIASIGVAGEIVPAPQMPCHMKGIMSFRDRVIGVIDLKSLVGLPSTQSETEAFRSMLDQRKQDHINWLNKLEESIRENSAFQLTTDPHACAFGKWYDTYKVDDSNLKGKSLVMALKKFDKPHKNIHAAADQVMAVRKSGDIEGGRQIVERTKHTDLKSMMDIFEEVYDAYIETRVEMLIVLEKDQRHIGILVDRVSSVEELAAYDHEDQLVEGVEGQIFCGMAKTKGSEALVVMLDENRFFEL